MAWEWNTCAWPTWDTTNDIDWDNDQGESACGTPEAPHGRDADPQMCEKPNKRDRPEEKAQPPKEGPPPKAQRLDEITINAAKAFWACRERAKCHKGPWEVIDNTKAGDDTMWNYFRKNRTFCGAEVYMQCEVGAAASASPHESSRCRAAAEKWWKSQDASTRSRRSKWPLARITGDWGSDEILRQHFESKRTFTGAAIFVRPLVASESDDDACKA